MPREQWFGTPVGAALLVGALAGGLGMINLCCLPFLRYTSWSATSWDYWSGIVLQVCFTSLHFSLYAAAAGVCLRSARKLLHAAGLGLLCGIMTMAHQFLINILMRLGNSVYPFYILTAATSMALYSLLGYATARLYGHPALRWKCLLVSLLCGIFNMAIWWLIWAQIASVEDPMGATSGELAMSLTTITALIQVVPLGFVIERYQARHRQNPAAQTTQG